jgi:tRNA threonylcarbamoyladenosine biosynthesis protein TsaE
VERIEFISTSPSDTVDIAEKIGEFAGIGDLVLIYGDLGAGKTQFVKGLAKGLEVPDWEYVISPTFTILTTYTGRCGLCHVDLYRLESVGAEDLGIEEYLDEGVVAVEWAEKSTWWEENIIKINISLADGEKRRIVLEVDDVGRAEVWRDVCCNT